VGVGDVGEVPCGARITRDATGGDDGRGSRGKHDGGLVVGHGGDERGWSGQPGIDRLGIDDGARGKHGAGGAHEQISGGGYRV
jgi:hypothetical protein